MPPVSYVFTRLRVDPTDRWRADPEPSLVRQFEVAHPTDFDATLTVRAGQRLAGDRLAVMLGEPVHANDHLTGVPRARGAAAFDGDVTTSWITSFGSPVGRAVNVQLEGSASTMTLTQPDGSFSPVTAVRVTDAAGAFDLDVPPATEATLTFPRPVSLVDATIEITGAEERSTLDRRFGERVVLPAAISEIIFDGVSPGIAPVAEVSAECRDDLLSVDGEPVGVSFTATAEQILSGMPIEGTVCGPSGAAVIALDAGTHTVGANPSASGWTVDQVVLDQPSPSEDPSDVAPPTAQVTESSRTSRTVEVSACPTGCWVVLGEGFNTGWSASTGDGSLGEPTLVDGNANGWWIEPSTSPTTVTITWTVQPALDVALLASLAGVLLALGLIVFDRRRAGDVPAQGRLPRLVRWSEWSSTTAGLATVVTATVAAVLFIGWWWGLAAGLVCVAVRFTGRPRLLGVIGLGIVVLAQVLVVTVVLRERPYPNAGWPVRFEWLHPWTLLGVVLMASATLFARDADPPATGPDE